MKNIINDYSNLPRKINIGCGFDIRQDFLNVDSGEWHKPDLIADVTNLTMLPDDYFDEAVAQDVLEHIPRLKQVSTLAGWARILRYGGSLRVRVPSVVDMVKLLEDPQFKNDVERQHYWVQMLYGTQAYPGDFHLCGYTSLTLADLGIQTGMFLSEITIKDGWLFDATFKKVDTLDELCQTAWLTFQYVTKLQRTPDRDGLAYWAAQLASGAVTREQVSQEFAKAMT